MSEEEFLTSDYPTLFEKELDLKQLYELKWHYYAKDGEVFLGEE